MSISSNSGPSKNTYPIQNHTEKGYTKVKESETLTSHGRKITVKFEKNLTILDRITDFFAAFILTLTIFPYVMHPERVNNLWKHAFLGGTDKDRGELAISETLH